MKISDNTSVSMPMRNLLSIVGACMVGAWFGFGVIERLNIIETELQLMQQDLLEAIVGLCVFCLGWHRETMNKGHSGRATQLLDMRVKLVMVLRESILVRT